MPTRVDIRERFWSKVEKTSTCWLWRGALRRRAYGRYGRFWANGQSREAHRIAYEITIGPIPPGLTLDHQCGEPRCVNPSHLVPMSLRENILRGIVNPTAINARRTTCKYGHPFDATFLHYGRPARRCLACRRRLNEASRRRCRARAKQSAASPPHA